MAVGDIVRTIRPIRTFDPKTLNIRPDGIPSSSLGTIIVQDDPNRFVSVEFEFIRQGLKEVTKVIGVFGEGTVDTIENSLEFVTVQEAPDPIADLKAASTVGITSGSNLALS